MILHDLKCRNKWFANYFISYVARRSIFLILVFDVGSPGIQICCMLWMNLAMHLYVAHMPMYTLNHNLLHWVEE